MFTKIDIDLPTSGPQPRDLIEENTVKTMFLQLQVFYYSLVTFSAQRVTGVHLKTE